MNNDNIYNRLILALVDGVSRNVCYELHKSSTYKNKPTDRFGFWPTLYLDEYIKALKLAQANINKNHCVRFLECGSGFGLMTKLAQEVIGSHRPSTKFHGIDIVEKYVKEAWLLWDCGGSLFFSVADILTFEHYSDYNIMFWWTPIKGDANEEFERKAVNDSPQGTIFIINVTYRTLFCEKNKLPVKEITTDKYSPIRVYKKI